ncbi:MAG: GntR family transcriptional regulator [Micromonosporaceae bacterium]
MTWNDRSDRIARDGPALIWAQIADDIRADLDAGRLKAGDKLPSDFDLAASYGVARSTARRALFELTGEGRLVVVFGRGTFVA